MRNSFQGFERREQDLFDRLHIRFKEDCLFNKVFFNCRVLHVFGFSLLLFGCSNVDIELKNKKRSSSKLVILSISRSNIRLDVFDILLNAFIDDLLSDYCVEEHIKLNDHSLEVIFLISIFFCHEEPILFFQNVLDFADNVRSPDNLPVFLRIEGLFVKSFFEMIK